jgi:hypothetical protein
MITYQAIDSVMHVINVKCLLQYRATDKIMIQAGPLTRPSRQSTKMAKEASKLEIIRESKYITVEKNK